MKNSGAGAWEVAFRYSYANLISNNIIGGKQSDFTAGLNWYLNPVTRVMLNHVLASIKDKGNASVFQVRFQVEF
jgi:phosphate-selective porin OprO/OprP